jgi:hypothetical protein
LYNCTNDGIETFSPSGGFITITSKYNYIHNNGNIGHQMDGSGIQTVVASNNIVVNNSGSGFQNANSLGLFTVSLFNNTIAGNTGTGIVAQYGSWNVQNNILYNNGGLEYSTLSTVYPLVSDHNDIVHSAGGNFMSWHGTPTTFTGWQSISNGYDTQSLTADPTFISVGGNNYALSNDSPVSHAGASLGVGFSLVNGSSWPLSIGIVPQPLGQPWDIGAYRLLYLGPLALGTGLSTGF